MAVDWHSLSYFFQKAVEEFLNQIAVALFRARATSRADERPGKRSLDAAALVHTPVTVYKSPLSNQTSAYIRTAAIVKCILRVRLDPEPVLPARPTTKATLRTGRQATDDTRPAWPSINLLARRSATRTALPTSTAQAAQHRHNIS